MRSIFVNALSRRRPLTALSLTFALIILSATACQKSQGASPTATFRAFYEALKKKDVEAYKKSVSKNTLVLLEKRAKDMNRSLDDYVKHEMDKPTTPPPENLETRNEKIDGEKATLEVKNTEGGWNTVPFIKEDGQWKVAVEEL
ncbi:MAG: DUF4878 domain-containing protein [Pyrinomonadaceae bacterium]